MGVISRVTILITHIRGLILPLITTHEPPSVLFFMFFFFGRKRGTGGEAGVGWGVRGRGARGSAFRLEEVLVCGCVCVCIYIYIYICICVCAVV